MKIMNFAYRLFYSLPNFARIGFLGKVINKILEKSLKFVFDYSVPRYLSNNSSNELGINRKIRDEKYIVSLTSFPARIDEIWITLETILRQTFKPDAIILYLAKEQFPGEKIPENLSKLKSRGVDIRFCDEDLRSHKKYFYVLKEFQDANIITLDDDVYYPNFVLKELIKLHKKYPKAICANRAHLITFNSSREVNPYNKWKHNYKSIKQPSLFLSQVGVGGVLYPPNCLSAEVLNKDVFKEVCFFADDLWLKLMSTINKTPIVTSSVVNKNIIAVSKSQKERLLNLNSKNGGNTQQLNNLLEFYNLNLYQLLSELENDKTSSRDNLK